MGVTKYRDGDVTITLDDGLARFVRAAVEDVIPGVLTHMERRARAVLAEAKEAWPVRTGESRDSLHVETVVSDAKVTVRIRSTGVAYVPFIEPARLHGVKAWTRYVLQPVGRLHKELVEELGPQIVEALRVGRAKGGTGG